MNSEKEYLTAMDDSDEEYSSLLHYGTPRHSGRYPWGSGKNPQRSRDLLSKDEYYRKKGLSQKEIAVALGFKNTVDYRAAKAQASAARAADNYKTAMALVEKHHGNKSAAAREMGVSESSLRSFIRPPEKRTQQVLNSTTSLLKSEMDKLNGDYLYVGKNTHLFLGVTESRLNTAVEALKQQGYEVHSVKVDQLDGSGNVANAKIICPKGTTWGQANNNQGKIHLVEEGGKFINSKGEIQKLHDPVVVSKSRIYVRYAEDGGKDRDGTIEIRPGVDDLNLGQAKYAQVRIQTDDNQYMKGMCHYSKNVPEGYDIVYNTNKTREKAASVFKSIDDDKMDENIKPVDRFGALIVRQNDWTDNDGNEHKGALNIMREEGKWTEWSEGLPAQFLSKQRPELAKQQLNIDYAKRSDQFDEISRLTNPVLKQALLKPFADECDAAAVDLKAASLPRQGWHTIMPNPKLKDNEVYAPNFKDGERVVLVRFPHEGIYQIPELIVNNRSLSSKQIIGSSPKDAICINSKVAEQLSGADFDGDTVLVIPNNDSKIIHDPPIKELIEFDDKAAYPPIEGGRKAVVDKVRNPQTEYLWREQIQMGKISNLITDMTLMGAPQDELVRATKHAMTVIDVKKHNLDWQRSYQENNIKELVAKYQQKPDGQRPGGAGTLISRSGSEIDVAQRKPAFTIKDDKGNYIVKEGINVKTGEKVYQPTERMSRVKNPETGEYDLEKLKTFKSTRMYEAKDARELMSGPNHEGTNMERIYADYANRCKALGNRARKEYLGVQIPSRDPVAAKTYASEVASLKAKLLRSEKNAPLEMLAKIQANERIKAMRQSGEYSGYTANDWKKEKGKALERARRDVGAKKHAVDITDREWEAIQHNAISPTTLRAILKNTDLDKLKLRAMPKQEKVLTESKIAMIKAYSSAGRTQKEIADALGLSVSSVRDALTF
jgi:transposase-like protein